jgi:hypothetical protein
MLRKVRMTLSFVTLFVFATSASSLSFSQPYPQAEEIQNQQRPSPIRAQTSPKIQDDRKESGQAETKDQNPKNYWKRLVAFVETNDKFVNAISTTVIAAFTFALFVATAALWIAGARHSERQLRAYIAIHLGEITHAVVDGGPGYRVHIELKNSGQTPAYDFTTWIKAPMIAEVDKAPFGPPRPIGERTAGSVVGPGTSVHQHWYARWSETELADIRASTKAIFVSGGSDYKDIFGRRRHFHYRISITGSEDSPNTWALKPHKSGYDAT